MARSFIAQFLVNVTTKGHRQAQVDTNKLAASVDKVAEAHENANKKQKNYNNTMEKGIIGTANGTKSFSKMASTMGQSGTSLVGIYATLAANVFAVTAAFNALRGAAQVQQVIQGLEASGARLGMTLTVTANSVRDLAEGMLTTEQALRSTAQFMAGGFKTEQLERMTVLARDISIALGRNMTDSMDRLTRGTLKLEPELLDELGIMTKLGDATAKYAAELGKPVAALTQLERRQGFMNAVLQEGELKFGGLGAAAGDTAGYDKLGATFSDLVKTVLNGVNTFALPLANLFATTKIGLAGLAVLFATTIRGQLLPMFNNLGAAAEKASNQIRSKAIKTIGDMADGLDDNRHDVKVWADEVEKGTARSRDFSRTLLSVDTDIQKLERSLAGSSRSVKKRTAWTEELETLRTVRTEMVAYERATNKATGHAFASAGINEISSGNFKAGIKDLDKSFNALNASLPETATRLDRVKNAATKAGIGLKAFGAGFLYLLPYLGIAITAWGVLSSLLEGTTSEAQKKLNKATEEYGTIIDSVQDKVKEYNRLQLSSASAAARVVATTKLQANALGELNEKYSEIIKLQKEVERREESQSQDRQIVRGVGVSSFGNERTLNAYDKQRLRQASANEAGTDSQKLFSGLSKESLEFAKSLEQLNNRGWKEQIKSMGSANIAMGDIEQKEKLLTIIGSKLTISTQRGASAVEEAANAFKEADDAIGKFMVSSAQKTPFDDMQQGAFNSAMAVRTMQIEMERGNVTAAQFAETISGLGERFRSVLSMDVSNLITEFNKADAQVQALKNDPNASASDIGNAERNRINIGRDLTNVAQAQVLAFAKQTSELQRQSRVMEGQLKLEEARRQTTQSIYTLNGKGMLEQFEHEEKMRGIRVSQLQLEMKLYDNIIAKNKARIQELEMLKEIVQLTAYNNAVEERMITIRAKQAELSANTRMSEAQKASEILKIMANTSIVADALAEAGRLTAEYNISIDKLKQDSLAAESSRVSLQNQISAILAENLTTEQKLSRSRQKDYEVTQKYIELLKEHASIINTIEDTTSKIESLVAGQTSNLLTQAAVIQKNANVQRQQLRVEAVNNAQRIAHERAVIVADRNRAVSQGQAAEGAALALANMDRELQSQDKLNELKLISISRTELLNLLELAVFDTRKEGLEWQKEGISLQQKALEVEKDLATNVLKNAQARERAARVRTGGTITEGLMEAQEVEAATQAYKLALSELKLRESMIDLEYALMDAQRVALREELSARKAIILQTTQATEDSPHIKQLNRAISNLDKAPSLEEVAIRAKEAGRAALEGQRLGLQELVRGTGSEFAKAFLGPIQEGADVYRKAAADRAAWEASKQVPVNSLESTIAKATSETIPVKLDALTEAQKAPPTVMFQIKEAIADVARNTAELVRLAGGRVGGEAPNLAGGPQAAAAAAGRWLQGQNLKVWEHPEFGGVRGQHKGAGHAEGRAIDVYSRAGTGEWDDKNERARYQNLAKELRAMGATVLFGVEGHFDHMHVEFARGFDASRVGEVIARHLPEVASSTAETAVSVDPSVARNAGARFDAQAASSALPGVGTNSDITVTGRLPEKPSIGIAAAEYEGPSKLKLLMDSLAKSTSKVTEQLRELGPEGEIVVGIRDGMLGIGNAMDNAFKAFKSGELHDKIAAVAGVAQQTISMIANVSRASSDAKIAAVDREIAAEQKRDGKSAESQAKIEALERRKDQIAKKQFNTNKKLMMANAVIGTAAGVAQALGSLPFPANVITAGIIGAMGVAQLAIIAGTSYQSAASTKKDAAPPTSMSIGKRGDSVDLARNNPNAGGEIGYLRGARGSGRNASNYQVIGSAYGGPVPRGYGNTAFAVGEHGPEIITPDNPVTVRPIDNTQDNRPAQPVNFNIQALDASGVQQILMDQRGNIIGMLREAANANGQTFLEDVNVNVYTSPRTSRI
jgi:hypothetical protein